MSAEKASNWRKHALSVLLPLLISALALWFILRKVNLHEVLGALKQFSAKTLMLLLFWDFLGLVLRGWVCLIILGKPFNFWDAFHGMTAGYMLNNLLPLRLGEAGRTALLSSRHQGVPFMQVFSAVISERLLDMILGAGFFLATLPLVPAGKSLNRLMWVAMGLLLGLVALAVWASKRQESLIQSLRTRFAQRPFVNGKLLPWLESLLTGFRFFLDPKRLISATVILAFSWACSMSMFYHMQTILLTDPQWWWSVLVVPASAFINALPSAPAGIGVFEAGTVGAFALVGVDRSVALTMALISHAVQFVCSSLAGFGGLLYFGESFSSVVQKAFAGRNKSEGEA